MNYINSFNEDYAQSIRDKFFEDWKETLSNTDKDQNKIQKNLKRLSEISDEDIPKSKKMELILIAQKNNELTEEGKAMGKKASEYFNERKKTILATMQEAFYKNLHYRALQEHVGLSRFSDEQIEVINNINKQFQSEPSTSTDELNKLKMNYAKELAKQAGELLKPDSTGKITNPKEIKTYFNNFVNDPSIGLSDQDKDELKAEFDQIVDLHNLKIKKDGLIKEIMEKKYLTEKEKEQFLSNSDIQNIDYDEFKAELSRQYPITDDSKRGLLEKLNAFEVLIDEYGIQKEINDYILDPATKLDLKTIAMNIYHSHKERVGFQQAIDDKKLHEAIEQYTLKVLRDAIMDTNKMNKEDQKAFLNDNAEFKFILDQKMLGEFTRKIKDLKTMGAA